MHFAASQIRIVMTLAGLFVVEFVAAQDETLPDARTLLLDVWRNEELVRSAQGTFKWRQTILNNGSVLNDRTESAEFAIEIDNAFRYVPSENEYSIIATRNRVVRFSSQAIEEFPLSVWDGEPFSLSWDVFRKNSHIEAVLRPLHRLHSAHGPRVSERDLEIYFDCAVAVEGDVFKITCRDDDATTELRVSKDSPRRFVSITTRAPVMAYDSVDSIVDTLVDQGMRVGTRRESIVGDSLREVYSIEIEPDSVNQPLPESTFEIPSSENRISVDLRRLDHRLSYWISDGILDNPAYAFENFRDMFPGLFVGLVALLAIALVVASLLIAIAVRRIWSGVKSGEGT